MARLRGLAILCEGLLLRVRIGLLSILVLRLVRVCVWGAGWWRRSHIEFSLRFWGGVWWEMEVCKGGGGDGCVQRVEVFNST
jgi:hypothetical protein